MNVKPMTLKSMLNCLFYFVTFVCFRFWNTTELFAKNIVSNWIDFILRINLSKIEHSLLTIWQCLSPIKLQTINLFNWFDVLWRHVEIFPCQSKWFLVFHSFFDVFLSFCQKLKIFEYIAVSDTIRLILIGIMFA